MTASEVHATLIAAIDALAVDKTSDADVMSHHPYHTDKAPGRDRIYTLRPRKLWRPSVDGGDLALSCEDRLVLYELRIRYDTSSEYHVTRMLADAELLIDALLAVPSSAAGIERLDEVESDMDDVTGVAEHSRSFVVRYRV